MFHNSINYSFRHSKIALLTKHEKQQVISPLVENFLGSSIVALSDFDTDVFGTFTREIKRSQGQLETARMKAKKAIELSGYEIGMGSEGSFDIDPYVGMMPWNTEMVLLYDAKNDLEIVGIEQRPFTSVQKLISDPSELTEIANTINFPKNNLVMRPNDENNPHIKKDFTSLEDLQNSFQGLKKLSSNGKVFIENDHRAHRSQNRMEAIKNAAINLVIKCHTFCPQCMKPGFWVSKTEPGLPCKVCAEMTDTFKYLVYKCPGCAYEMKMPRQDIDSVEPQYCNWCNP